MLTKLAPVRACLLAVHLKKAWLCGAAVVVIVLVVAILGQRRRYERRAVFPASPPVTKLAIRAPLVRPDLTVMATLRVSERRVAPVWMAVDSGATGVTMPTEAYYSLGLDALRNVTIRQEDPVGRVIHRDAGLVPQLQLGALVIDDVVTALGGGDTILGQSVLAHGVWEIDWDRGLLTLNGTQWAPDANTVVLPLRKEGDSEVVTLHVDGAPIEMVIDTGAFVSTIPERVGASAGLSGRRLPPTTLHSLTGELVVRKLFAGVGRLGPLSLGHLELAAIHAGGRRASLGLLGLDVLSRYQVQIVPGAHLALRLRGDVRKTTAERIARWSFVPTSCAHPGCVHATLAAKGDHALLSVTLDADMDQPIEVLLGCAGDRGDTVVPTQTSFAFGEAPTVARHVRMRLPGRARGSISELTIANGAAWFGSAGGDCHALEALDVSPILAHAPEATDAQTPETELQATLLP